MRWRFFFALIMAAFLAAIASLWLWLVLSPEPLNNPASQWLPWPIACSTRGCVTTRAWQRQWTLKQTFADKSKAEVGSANSALTTLIRQHLVRYATVKSNVTDRDAERYREEILNIKSPERVKDMTGLTLSQYDERVIKRFLEQENLRQERQVSNDELFKQLAKERFVLILSFRLGWNRAEAKVE